MTEIKKGMLVKSRDGALIGRIVDITDDSILVERGAFFTVDCWLPSSDVSGVQADAVHLARSRDELGRMAGGAPRTDVVTEAVGRPGGGGLGLGPRDLERARMDSAKFQDHDRYDLRATGGERPVGEAEGGAGPVRSAPASEEGEAQRTAGPGEEPKSRY